MAREILFDLGKMITDRIPYKLGLKRLNSISVSASFRTSGSSVSVLTEIEGSGSRPTEAVLGFSGVFS